MNDRMEPEWLAHRYDENNDTIRFVRYDRDERDAVPFLVDGHLPDRDFQALSRSEARAQVGRAPIHFIFHSGFCCSTLLTSALDQPGLASGFSEPTILNDAFGWRLRGASPSDLGELVDDALGLLARPFDGDAAAVIKPSTVVNGMAEAMLAIRPNACAILMYAPLKDFLTSIAKKGLEGRLWVRDLLIKCRAERRTEALGFADLNLLELSDLQAAAVDWLMQQSVFAQIIARYPGRAASLSSEAFLADPGATISSAARLFRLSMSDDQLDAAMSGPMQRNSKDGSSFGTGDRRKEYDEAYRSHADEIDKVTIWAEHVAHSEQIPMGLPNSLLKG